MKLRSGRILDDELSPDNCNQDLSCHSNLNTTENLGNEQCQESPISACKKCVTCNHGFLKTDSVYTNKVTGEQFTITDEMDCKTTGIVYLITCAEPNCPLQYTGQSVNSVNTRYIQHRSGLISGNEPKFVREHFTKVYKPSDLRITPLRKVTVEESDPKTKRKSLVEQLKAAENSVILQLNCLFPYGFNDQSTWMQKSSSFLVLAFTRFFQRLLLNGIAGV